MKDITLPKDRFSSSIYSCFMNMYELSVVNQSAFSCSNDKEKWEPWNSSLVCTLRVETTFLKKGLPRGHDKTHDVWIMMCMVEELYY